jgi:hypothetical protein
VLEGVISSSSAPYGKQMTVEFGKLNGTYPAITKFEITIRASTTIESGKGSMAKTRKVGYIELVACPKAGQLAFADTTTFDSGSPASTTATAPCTK